MTRLGVKGASPAIGTHGYEGLHRSFPASAVDELARRRRGGEKIASVILPVAPGAIRDHAWINHFNQRIPICLSRDDFLRCFLGRAGI
jgi:hypothetical protein